MYSQKHRSNAKNTTNIICEIYKLLIENSYSQALEKIKNLADKNENISKNIIKNTSLTAYRKIHSIISSIIDRLSMIDIHGKTVDRDIASVITELTKAALLVKYQENRKLLNSELAEGIFTIITKEIIPQLENYLSSEHDKLENLREAEKHANALKIILDGILALHLGKLKKR